MEIGLRIVLLIIGCIIIAGIIWDYRRRPARTATKPSFAKHKKMSPASAVSMDCEAQATQKTTEPSMIVLHLLAKQPNVFSGEALIAAFEKVYLFYGARKIFYGYQYPRAKGSNKGAKLFTVVSMVEPGFFDLRTLSDFVSPGISLFIMLDNHLQPFAFESMLKTAKSLALLLGAELRNQTFQPLDAALIQHYRERVTEHLAALCTLDLAVDN